MSDLVAAESGTPGVVSRDDNTIRVFVAPTEVGFSLGTWTLAVASNVWSLNKTAADTTPVVFIPLPDEYRNLVVNGQVMGCEVMGVEVMFSTLTAVLDAVPLLDIFKDTFAVDGTLNTSAVVAATKAGLDVDIDESRASALLAAVDRFFLNDATHVHAELTLDGAATTVNKVFGAIWQLRAVSP